MIREAHIKTLTKYLPAESLQTVCDMIPRYGIHLEITRTRASRHGDFRYDHTCGKYYITVNGSLSPYAFLLTFIHEVAHLVVHKEKGNVEKPHSQVWKDTFRRLMMSLPLSEIYPDDILVPLLSYLKNPLSTADRHNSLSKALKSYDSYGNKIEMMDDMSYIENLSTGDEFIFREKRYTLGTKRRRLYLCILAGDGRQYLFSPLAQVKKIKHDDK